MEEGLALCIHYRNDWNQGVIDYERGDRGGRNDEVPVHSLYNPVDRDDGWIEGNHTLTFTQLQIFKKAVAISIAICSKLCKAFYVFQPTNPFLVISQFS